MQDIIPRVKTNKLFSQCSLSPIYNISHMLISEVKYLNTATLLNLVSHTCCGNSQKFEKQFLWSVRVTRPQQTNTQLFFSTPFTGTLYPHLFQWHPFHSTLAHYTPYPFQWPPFTPLLSVVPIHSTPFNGMLVTPLFSLTAYSPHSFQWHSVPSKFKSGFCHQEKLHFCNPNNLILAFLNSSFHLIFSNSSFLLHIFKTPIFSYARNPINLYYTCF